MKLVCVVFLDRCTRLDVPTTLGTQELLCTLDLAGRLSRLGMMWCARQLAIFTIHCDTFPAEEKQLRWALFEPRRDLVYVHAAAASELYNMEIS